MSRRMNSIRILLAALVMISTGIDASCSRNNGREVVSLRVGILKDLTSGPDVIAEDQGFFADAGLNVTLVRFETGAQACAELLRGNLDIARTAEYVAVRNILSNQPLNILASDSKYDGVLLAARKGSGIDSVTGLKGHRVGVNTDTVNYFYLSRLLERNGIDLKDITVVNGTQSQLVSFYNRREINAVVFSRIFVDQLVPQSDILTWPAQGNQTGYRVAAARPDWVEANHEAIEWYLGAIDRAVDLISSQQANAKMIIAEKQNLESHYIEAEWPLTRFQLSLDLALVSTMNDQAQWINESGTEAAKIPDFASFFYVDALKDIKREAVTIIR